MRDGQYFLMCTVYPRVDDHIRKTTEITTWPPADDAPDDDAGESRDAERLRKTASILARLFVIRAPDEGEAGVVIAEYLHRFDVTPFEIVLLEIPVSDELIEPFAEVPEDSNCCYPASPLFVLADREPETLESLFEFLCETMVDGE